MPQAPMRGPHRRSMVSSNPMMTGASLSSRCRARSGGKVLLVDAKRVIPAVLTRFQPLTGLFLSHRDPPIGHLL